MKNKDSENFKESFPGWDGYHEETDVETMPWYEKNLDHDADDELKSDNHASGSFLDLGTGPGTQAFQLSEYDFDVTGTDISQNAIEKAKELSGKISFIVDDILNSKLSDKKFNFILNGGTFHIFDISQRPQYVKQITRILDDNGILFLKRMSVNEKNMPDNDMPRKLSRQDVMDSFGDNFDALRVGDGELRGVLEFYPKALFSVLKKKSK